MKEITKKIIQFFKNHLTHIHLPSNKLSSESMAFFKQMVEHLNSADALFKNTDVSQTHYKKVLENGSNFFHIPKDVRDEIDDMDLESTIFSFRVLERSYKVTMIHEGYNKIELLKRIHRIFLWLYLVNIYNKKPTCSQHVDIYLYFTQLKKLTPNSKSHVISQINANTAFTTPCQSSTQIYVYREEEWFKVLIHESFHNMGFDFAYMDSENIDILFRKIFPLDIEFRIYEAYTETWAETIHCLVLSYIFKKVDTSSKERLDTVSILKSFDTLLWNERKFTLFQCAKVLHFNGISYSTLYEKTPEANKTRKQKYKERTYIFSYYILKAIFMFHTNDFITWCIKNNSHTLTFKEENLKAFIEFIRQIYTSREFIVILKQFEEWYYKNTISNEVLRTMRMTMFEIQ
jgi:hypothetical protein